MDLIQAILDKVKEENEHDPRIYSKDVFRASQIGGCPRSIQYGILGELEEKFTPETLLIFNDGHIHEASVKSLLNKVVTLSHNGKDISKRYNHKGHKFTITGHIDCVIHMDDRKIMTDIKSMSPFAFKYLDRDFEEKYSHYIDQVTIYMDIEKIYDGALLIKNKGDGELVFKEFPYNPKRMEGILDRIVEIRKGIKSKTMIEQPYPNSHYFCKTCTFRFPCRKLPMEGKRWSSTLQNPAPDVLERRLRESIKAKRKGRRS